MQNKKKYDIKQKSDKKRGVAQPGRVLGLGPRCRMFESCHPDHLKDGMKISSFFIKTEQQEQTIKLVQKNNDE